MKRKTDNFSKFINRKSTAAVKEEIRQEKKLIKKERREAVDRHFEEKRNKRAVAASLKTDETDSSASPGAVKLRIRPRPWHPVLPSP